jgi:hypothetical protein
MKRARPVDVENAAYGPMERKPGHQGPEKVTGMGRRYEFSGRVAVAVVVVVADADPKTLVISFQVLFFVGSTRWPQ